MIFGGPEDCTLNHSFMSCDYPEALTLNHSFRMGGGPVDLRSTLV